MDFELLDSAIQREIGCLARSTTPEEESWKRLRDLFLNMADALRLRVGETRPPVGLDRMKEVRRIKREVLFGSPDGPDAMLSPSSEGFTLRLKAGQPAVRYRFSTAHEIGHTFFYDIGKTPPRRLLTAGSPTRLRGSRVSSEDKEEAICSVFAGALLLPRDSLLEELESMPSDRGLFLWRIARKYAVSLEAVARRLLVDLSVLRNTLVLLRSVRQHHDGYELCSIRGKQLASYTRVREVALIDRVRRILEDESDPRDTLKKVGAMGAREFSISNRVWNNGERVVAVLCFRGDASEQTGILEEREPLTLPLGH
jgi:hypothetical protein